MSCSLPSSLIFIVLSAKISVIKRSKMSSISLPNSPALARLSPPSLPDYQRRNWCRRSLFSLNPLSKLQRFGISDRYSAGPPWPLVVAFSGAGVVNSLPPKAGTYTVGDFMTKKEDLHVVKTTTTVEEALDALVEKRITGFPVVDDDWKLVGVVSDYDLLALDSLLGGSQSDAALFPDVDSSWKTFNELQKLLSKTNGKVIGDVMTPAPLVVRETTNLEDAARLLLETKYRRLPVVDADGKLVGIITRGNVVRAALQIKRALERST